MTNHTFDAQDYTVMITKDRARSFEDGQFVGRCEELPSIVTYSTTFSGAYCAVIGIIQAAYLSHARGEDVPPFPSPASLPWARGQCARCAAQNG